MARRGVFISRGEKGAPRSACRGGEGVPYIVKSNVGYHASILVIDDDAAVCDVLSAMLRADGYIVQTAPSGREGVDCLRNGHFEVALTDLVMPEMDGIQTMGALKDVDADIEVIFVTGHAAVESASAAFRQGACDYLRKPISAQQLHNAVARAIEVRRLNSSLAPYEAARALMKSSNRRDLTISEFIKRQRAEAEMAKRHELATLMAEVGDALSRAETLSQGLQRCAEIMVRNLDAASARVWTVNEEERVLELQASAGIYTPIDGVPFQVPIGKFKIGRIAKSGEPYLTNSVKKDPLVGDAEAARLEGRVAFAGYPLKVEERVLGVLVAFGHQPFTEATLQAFTTVTDNIAQFIKRKRAEEALRLTQSSLDAAILPAFWVNPDGRFLYVNDATCELLGYSRSELVSMTVSNISPDWPADLWRVGWNDLKAAGSLIVETRQRTKSGQIIPVEISTKFLEFDRKEFACTFVQDISGRRRAEESRAFLASLVESPQDAIVGKTLEGTIVSWNQGAAALYGFSAEEVIGKSVSILIPPDHAHELAWLLDKGSQGERISSRETVRMRKNGSRVEVSLTLSPIYDGAGIITGIATIARDITDRKRAEQQARLQTAALESAANSIAIISRNGRISWVNPAFTRLTGYSAAEVIGSNPRILKSGVHDAAFYAKLWDTVLRGETWQGELVNRRKDGTLYTEEMTVNPVPHAHGGIGHFVAIKQDITARKGAAEELLFKTALLEAESETTIDGVLVVDGAGHVIQVNKRFAEMWRLPDDLVNSGNDKKILQFVLAQLKDPSAFLERVNYLYAHENERTRDEVEFADGRIFDRYSSPLQSAQGSSNWKLMVSGCVAASSRRSRHLPCAPTRKAWS